MKFDLDKEWCIKMAKLEEEANCTPMAGGHQQRNNTMAKQKSGKLAALEKKMAELQEQMRTEGQQAFNEAIKEVFEAHPEVEAFRWTQYTPYFNDGDTCTFGVETDIDLLPSDKTKVEPPEGKSKYAYEIEDGWYRGGNGAPDHMEAASNDFSACLRISDLMLSLFGDHVKVTCYRDHIEVEEYQHD